MKRPLPHIIAVYNCNAFGLDAKVYDKIYGSKGYDLYADYCKANETDNLETEILDQSEFRRIDKSKYYEINKEELGTIYEYKANKMLTFQIAKKEISRLNRVLQLCDLDPSELTEKDKKSLEPYSVFMLKAKKEILKDIDYVNKCVDLCKAKTFYQV